MRRDDPNLSLVEQGPALPYPSSAVVAALSPLVLPRRLARMQAVIGQRTHTIVPVLEGLVDPHNTSAVLRSCDAFGLQQVHLVEHDQKQRAAQTVSKGAERWLSISKHNDSDSCFQRLRDSGYEVWVAAMEAKHTARDLCAVPKVAVVFGNEHRGPSATAREHATGFFAVPMRGFVESLNVSVAAAITFSTLREGRPGSLDPEAQQHLLAQFLWRTVKAPEKAVARHLEAGSGDANQTPRPSGSSFASGSVGTHDS